MKAVSPEDIAFIQSNAVYFDQARLNFLHGIQPQTRNRFADIYRTYLDPGFILTEWCSQCVVDMMRRLADWWEQRGEDIENIIQPVTEVFVFPDDLEDVKVSPADVDTIVTAEDYLAVYGQPVDNPTPPKRKRGRPKKQ